MKSRKSFILICLFFLANSLFAQSSNIIIPKPVSLIEKEGFFVIKDQLAAVDMSHEGSAKNAVNYLVEKIVMSSGITVNFRSSDEFDSTNCFIFRSANDSRLGNEGYKISVNADKVIIEADGPAGYFYAAQTILQLLPPEIYLFLPDQPVEWKIPCVEIADYPRYTYRGMHLDVSRHFFPAEFIKKYIDIIASYKFNTFHWHLTDDNGWRIEIDKYPKLTEISAWRVDRGDQPWDDWDPVKEGEKATYGGYYTKDQIREIVQYAAERNVTIIPEIEMPAHSSEVLAAYPELSCTGGPFHVQPGGYWPNIDIFCAGNDSTFKFLEDVLIEVMDLFPSEYIHIGGDEADKTRWNECPKCQKRIADQGLNDEKELQSYFIKRIEKFIVSKGRKIIGWDEILEGGLAPEATVMSWRGIEGGIEAARQGHDVIMTPTSYCYFDYYQGDPEFEPKAFGGYVTLQKVYSFEPTPEELNSSEAKHILGAQGNLWTEHIKTPEHAEYMAVPRLIALSEVNWTPKEDKSWPDFSARLDRHFAKLKNRKINYSLGSFKIDFSLNLDKADDNLYLTLKTEQVNPTILFTLDGTTPDGNSKQYSNPIKIDKTAKIKAGIFADGKLVGRITEKEIYIHKGSSKNVEYLLPYSNRYPAKGENNLVDGMKGANSFSDGFWQGFHGNDFSVIIDLGREEKISKISTGFYQSYGSWIFLPEYVEYSLSVDGKDFTELTSVENEVSVETKEVTVKNFELTVDGQKARFVKVYAKNIGICPPGHPGQGDRAWLFADEIIIE